MHTIYLRERNVFPIVLGAFPFGHALAENVSFGMMDAFAAAGGNMIDTANIYGFTAGGRSASEKAVAAWLKRSGAPVMISTKGAHTREDHMGSRVRPECIAMDVRESSDIFERRIDLYWLHRDDPGYPVEPLMDELFLQQDQGRIGAIGASNWSPERIAAANGYAADCAREGFVGSQVQYSLCMPPEKPDPELVWMDERADGPFFTRENLPIYAFSSQGKGYAAKVAEGRPLTNAAIYDTPANRRRAEVCARIAKEVGASVNGVSLAYLLHQSFPCAAVVGPRSERQVHDSVAAAHIRLSPAQVGALRNA